MLYLLKAKEQDLYKIGKTSGSVNYRVNMIQKITPFDIELVKGFDKGYTVSEFALHTSFQHCLYKFEQTNGVKSQEWFQLTKQDLRKVLDYFDNGTSGDLGLFRLTGSHYRIFTLIKYLLDTTYKPYSSKVCKSCENIERFFEMVRNMDFQHYEMFRTLSATDSYIRKMIRLADQHGVKFE